MSDTKDSIEGRILQAVKLTLAAVIKDTATPHGMRHPLSDGTIEDLRKCLALISARQRELAEAAGGTPAQRPQFADASPADEKVIRIHKREPPGDPR